MEKVTLNEAILVDLINQDFDATTVIPRVRIAQANLLRYLTAIGKDLGLDPLNVPMEIDAVDDLMIGATANGAISIFMTSEEASDLWRD